MDDKLTMYIQRWLAVPDDQRDLLSGAEMAFKLNRNRYMFERACARPERYRERIAYELKKFLRMRLDHMTAADVSRMEREVLPLAREDMEDFAPSTPGQERRPKPPERISFREADGGSKGREPQNAGDSPAVTEDDTENETGGKNAVPGEDPTDAGDASTDAEDVPPDADVPRFRGKRADHERLPERVRRLYDVNFDLYKSIKKLYNTCLAIKGKACDRYEYLKQLAEADRQYRDNWNIYDHYHVGEPAGGVDGASAGEGEPPGTGAELVKRLNAARKYVSSNLAKLEAMGADAPGRESLLGRMQERVDLITGNGGKFDTGYAGRLRDVGLRL